jgi:hypothetical protein
MKIVPISQILKPAGLGLPIINALIPSVDNYKATLLQPKGEIEANAAGVFNRDRALAANQFRKFLEFARETDADLAITPEYSMPWDVLVTSILEGQAPAPGKLWVLGCESITYPELEALKQKIGATAEVLFEPLENQQGRFLDPLAYVFLAPVATNPSKRRQVVLLQFKTHPMADADHFEVSGLQRGTCIYEFGGIPNGIRLVSLICSDALDFLDHDAREVYARALIIHIQLNPNPRHSDFRRYRDRLSRYHGDETELICLNWASDVLQWSGTYSKPWNNISGSAWYLKPKEFDARDETLSANHRIGLYYTWLKPNYFHALFFNYKPGLHLVEASKVAHHAVPAVSSRRRGPQLRKRLVWDPLTNAWIEEANPDDGFLAIIEEAAGAKSELQRAWSINAFFAERIIALCAGMIGNEADWYEPKQLVSCAITEAEVILRLTFCQDTDTEAAKFRAARLKRCAELDNILQRENLLPPALADFQSGFRLEWSRNAPHQNAQSADGKRATVVYMGEETNKSEIEATAMRLDDFLGRTSGSADEALTAQQRVAIWFRELGTLYLFEPHRHVQIDKPDNVSPFDISRRD